MTFLTGEVPKDTMEGVLFMSQQQRVVRGTRGMSCPDPELSA